jgi:hypothetical protein
MLLLLNHLKGEAGLSSLHKSLVPNSKKTYNIYEILSAKGNKENCWNSGEIPSSSFTLNPVTNMNSSAR